VIGVEREEVVMSARTPKTHGAKVRASRARSRVEAEKKAKARKPERAPDGTGSRNGDSGRAAGAFSLPTDDAAAEIRKKRVKRGKAGKVTVEDAKNSYAAAKVGTDDDRRSAGRMGKEKRKDDAGPEGRREESGAGRGSRRVRPVREAGSRISDHNAGGREPRQEKVRWNDIRPARTAVLGVLLISLLAALLWIYTATGVLNVKTVEVRGNQVLDADYLRSLSGITGDTHLIKMDVKAVERALMSEPYVAAVDISRRYPNTVALEIIERKPTGAIFQNGKYNILDQEGKVLESADEMPQGLVEIRDLELPLLFPGMEVSGKDFAAVTSLLGSLPAALREMTSAVGLSSSRGLYLESSGTVVIYGDVSSLSRKNAIALMALTGLVELYGNVEYIDVSFPDYPVIKPVQR
jgi:cell division protein FtsQ